MDHQAFRATQNTVQLAGLARDPLTVAYIDKGKGEPVVLLHGIPTWSYLYHAVIPLLSPFHRVLAPDFLGHGFSDQRDRFDRSLTAQTAMILELLDSLNIERANIVGHDTGGGVALIMAIHHPERVNRVVLSNIVAYDSWPIDDMISLGNPEWHMKTPAEISDFIASGLRDGLHNPDRLTREFHDGIVAPCSHEVGKISMIRNASALNTNHTMALVDRHCEILAQTLILWGVHDPWQKISDGKRLASDIPNSKLVCLENASHWLQQDAPTDFAREILAFLQDNRH